MIAEWMEIRGVKDKVLLGFDMLKKNLEGLRKGYVSTLIAEKPLYRCTRPWVRLWIT